MILYDNIIFSLQKLGGISKFWGNLIENYCANQPLQQITYTDCHTNLIYNELGLAKYDTQKVFERKRLLERYRPINGEGLHCDIFHSSFYRPIRNNSCKTVVTVHDLINFIFEKSLYTVPHRQIISRSIREADAIVCVSNHTKEDLFRFFPEVASKHISVIPNGYDKCFRILDHLESCGATREAKPYLLYVGSRGYCKNFEYVLSLLNECRLSGLDFNLKCVTSPAFSISEKAIIKRLSLDNNVELISHIKSDDLNVLYNNAHALIIPSLYEGFGIPALEARAAGCPVIASQESSLPEVVGCRRLIINPFDVQSGVRMVKELMSVQFRREIVSEQLDGLSSYTWKSVAKGYAELYQSIL
ncbi:glycosyltransferase family 4 protein [Planktomarina temperata]|nr:glycosyltransferase family 4 protein [Planktomarina temperata]